MKAGRPKNLLGGSIVTPSLESAIINGKYVNCLPLYRMEQDVKHNDVNLCRQNMANWRSSAQTVNLPTCTIFCISFCTDTMCCRPMRLLWKPQRMGDVRATGAKNYMWIQSCIGTNYLPFIPIHFFFIDL